jgi:hypothetical protein
MLSGVVSGTKMVSLNWIRIGLRQKRIAVTDSNGPVRWRLGHSCFHISQNEVEDDCRQEKSEETSVVTGRAADG